MKRSTTTLALLGALLLAACQTTGAVTAADPAPVAAVQKTEPKKRKAPGLKEFEAQLAKAQKEQAEAQREKLYTAADLEIAELKAAVSEIEVVESLRAALAKLQESRAAMGRFDEFERPLKIREADLELAEAQEDQRTAETDLQGILAIYAEETEARSKDEIIRRHRKQVETAEEEALIAVQTRALLVDHTLPATLGEKAEEVRVAEAGLAKAEAEALGTRRETELALEKAADVSDDAKRAAKRAKRKVDGARRRVNSKRETQGPASTEAQAESDG